MAVARSLAEDSTGESAVGPDRCHASDDVFCQLRKVQSEFQFGRLVRLARTIVDAPIAVLSLEDEGVQRIEASDGLDTSKAHPETAFFDRVIRQDEPLCVSDLRADTQFFAHESVRFAPFYRAFAGVPLVNCRGERIGSLCLFDYEQRTFTAAQLASLQDLASIAIDELRLKKAKRDAEAARRQLTDAIEALPDGFILFDEDDRLAVFNERMFTLYPESGQYLKIGRTFEEIMREAVGDGRFPEAVGREEEWLADRIRRHREPAGIIEQQTHAGRWLRIYEEKTSTGAIVGFRVDITELKQREAELFELATRDSLTGVLTRRAMLDEIRREFIRIERYSGNCAILIIDVDHFKSVNDIFGHQTGDEALRQICRRTEATIREADRIGRFGGEEFLVLMPDTDLHGAMITAERLRADIARLKIDASDSPQQVSVTVSIGVAEYRQGESADSILSRADRSLYQAKLNGRNCVHAGLDEAEWGASLS